MKGTIHNPRLSLIRNVILQDFLLFLFLFLRNFDTTKNSNPHTVREKGRREKLLKDYAYFKWSRGWIYFKDSGEEKAF